MSRQPSFNELKPKFCILMCELRTYWDHDPTVLSRDSQKDKRLRGLCVDLDKVAKNLTKHQNSAEGGWIAPVDEAFITQWALYERKLAKTIGKVALYDRDPEMAGFFDDIFGIDFQSPYEDGAEKEIHEREEKLLRFYIKDLRSARQELDEDSDGYEFLSDLEGVLIRLWKTAGFSLEAASERASLAPVVLVPRKIASKTSQAERRSLYDLWNEARKAYILGAPMASMAMARAVLEKLLHDAYQVKEGELKDRIDAAQKPGIERDRMHKMRHVGNVILHGLETRPTVPGKKAIDNPSQAALKILEDLKELIES